MHSLKSLSISFNPSRAFSVLKSTSRSFATESKPIKMDFKPQTFQAYKCHGPDHHTTTTKEELLGFFKMMTQIRRMEITADNLYKQKLIRGFCHLYNGQEAIAAGIESAITLQDNIITAYRDHGLMVARGSEPRYVLAELMMKATGCSKGKGGSMHMFDIPRNFWGGHGIVGAQTPLGAGLAFAQKYLGNKNITFTFYGDGAANQGQLFEAFNMSHLWQLPCVFVCENNQYAMGTSVGRATGDPDYYTRGHIIPGIKVDAMNVLAVRTATQYVANHIRTKGGPFVMEMNTYRYVGHSMSDPGTTYRTREEVDAVRNERDPITKVRNWILEYKFATEEELKEIEASIRKQIEEDVEWAKNGADPAPVDLFTDVYRQPVPIRHVELVNSYTP